MQAKKQDEDKTYANFILEASDAKGSVWDERHEEELERQRRQREAAEVALKKEYRDTHRWALVVMVVLTTITITISGFSLYSVSTLNSELRDVRDRVTALEHSSKFDRR